MSRSRLAAMGMAGVIALLACGAAPCAEPAHALLDAAALGKVEALAKFCGKADPASSGGLRSELARLTHGAPPGALAAARASDEYRQARDAVTEFTGKVDAHNVHRLCSRPLPGTR